MMHFDVVVIGSGPAGQKAAVQAAKSGHKVCVIEQEARIGGATINRGTLPSKALRENARRLMSMRQNEELAKQSDLKESNMSVLVNRMSDVLKAHDQTIEAQTNRNLISRMPGRASLKSRYDVQVERAGGRSVELQARVIVIATGSVPDIPDNVPVDHENLFDTDSILTMLYLPASLTILGSDIHACEFATIFQTLGVKVTWVGQSDWPLPELDQEVREKLVDCFEAAGGQWIGSSTVESTRWNGISQVETELDNGQTVMSEKLLCALGRKANVSALKLDELGITFGGDGFLEVNDKLQTSVPNIFAAGDVIGLPALASTSMEQGRRAICHAFRIPMDELNQEIPTGVYGIPEIASVGLSEAEALKTRKRVFVGRANFNEIVRGQISGELNGFLKLVCDSDGKKILGVQIVGEGATELIHIGQIALINHNSVDVFIDSVFNFPTMAEAYRVAALDVFGQRMKGSEYY